MTAATIATQRDLLSEYVEALEQGDNATINGILGQTEVGSPLDDAIYTFHRNYDSSVSFEDHLEQMRASGQIGE
ncbi:hypothetical protein [Ktedonobacter racemifer]|uniref:Uncharacterized protein n=1 Tax=Ktedonobacter racemifer DSM 44963 TaxID=485913 RepID=D6U2A6_KTERA|nr:hypothetical protein [Ktedonobacter racemifer]EFH82774.1 hypothetical protein Krac_3624 [Ktedonobacter racemifer DSM 44963]